MTTTARRTITGTTVNQLNMLVGSRYGRNTLRIIDMKCFTWMEHHIAEMDLDQNDENGGQDHRDDAPPAKAINIQAAGQAPVPLVAPRPGPQNVPGAEYAPAPAVEPLAIPRVQARDIDRQGRAPVPIPAAVLPRIPRLQVRPDPAAAGHAAGPQNQPNFGPANGNGPAGAAGRAPARPGAEVVEPDVDGPDQNQGNNRHHPYRGRRAGQEVQARRRSRRIIVFIADVLFESRRESFLISKGIEIREIY
ncbi:hypothetical protein QAD02_003171 [Eretmocerus hayati]|uniref:Uncharacterized protein n=1 Tax=Eretmocerus hayati TaxID=131215 RepID=A0ACC2NLC7_9HYME|nr:hypothetical protein QAD02_003171 [Eretmocerus hayati]